MIYYMIVALLAMYHTMLVMYYDEKQDTHRMLYNGIMSLLMLSLMILQLVR